MAISSRTSPSEFQCGSLRKATRLPLDVHLMIEQPEEYIEEFVHAGATRFWCIRKQQCTWTRAGHDSRTRSGSRRGDKSRYTVAMLSEVLDKLDTVLVMSVTRVRRQKFIPGALEKIRQLNQCARDIMAPSERGGWGVDLDNIAELARAGAILSLPDFRFFTQPIRWRDTAVAQAASEAVTRSLKVRKTLGALSVRWQETSGLRVRSNPGTGNLFLSGSVP